MNAVIEQPVESTTEEPSVPFEPGIRTDLEHADYLKVEALSASGIKRMLQSPAHYRFDKDHPAETTDAMLMGSAVHMAILEPERFATSVIVVPEDAPKRPTSAQWGAAKPSPSSLAAMQWWTDFNALAAGKLVLSAEQGAKVEGMANAVRRHPIHDEMMGSGHSEVSFFWRDARLDIPCKARFDRLNDSAFAFDVKSCQDASPEGFARLRAVDLIALVLGYGFLLAVFVGGVTTLIDAVQGNPNTVWPQIAALLSWIDGGAR